MFTSGTVVHSIYRGVLVFVSFAVTTILAGNPQWGEITVGSIVFALAHFITSQLAATE